MNTPAHVVFNLALLSRHPEAPRTAPIVIGSLIPDAPMFAFYAIQRIGLGATESEIWNHAYYQPAWQNFFDAFNALPLIALGYFIAKWTRSYSGCALFASMALHALCDFPLHHGDAHRHFLPLSDWRFQSPLSYWDPQHYGQWVTLAEIGLVLASAFLLWKRHARRGPRVTVAISVAVYASYLGFAFLYWG